MRGKMPTPARIGRRRAAKIAGAVLFVGAAVFAGMALAESGPATLCVPESSNGTVRTPSAGGTCKAKYRLVTLGAQGPTGKEGPAGPGAVRFDLTYSPGALHPELVKSGPWSVELECAYVGREAALLGAIAVKGPGNAEMMYVRTGDDSVKNQEVVTAGPGLSTSTWTRIMGPSNLAPTGGHYMRFIGSAVLHGEGQVAYLHANVLADFRTNPGKCSAQGVLIPGT